MDWPITGVPPIFGLTGLFWLILVFGVTLFITGVDCCNLGVPLEMCGVPLRLGGCWLRWLAIVAVTDG